MIDYIKGSIAELGPTRIVVDNQGIGYGLEISLQSFEDFKNKKETTAYTLNTVNQRDGSQITYGFSTKNERDIFVLITGVSGIGASTARMILSSLNVEEFKEVVLSENINKLKSVKGIGLKGAQRLVLELKDKIVKGEGNVSESIICLENNDNITEASSALQMLGFAKPNINKVIQQITKQDPRASVEEIIKKALKML